MSLFGSFSASRALDPLSLDPRIVKAFEARPKLVEAIDNWILVPDYSARDVLNSLVDQVEAIQQAPLVQVLYRGFDLRRSKQNTMGLSTDQGLWYKIKPHVVGSRFNYTLTTPLSFTTNEAMAQAFGDVVISIDPRTLKNRKLWISPELSYVISRRRNISPQTQDEVILLPDSHPFQFTVIKK